MTHVSNQEKVTPLGNARFRVERTDGARQIAFGIAEGSRTWVFLDGDVYVLDSAPPRRPGTRSHGGELSAPMPATVTQVHVAPGQSVRAGDVLVTLEAMKMELPIRASADGTVAAVNCRPGEMVHPGAVLVDVRERAIPGGDRPAHPEDGTRPRDADAENGAA